MKANQSIWDKFTNLYPLQKTLRFELKPVGKTEEHIQKAGIIGVDTRGDLSGSDAIRAKEYKIMKKLLDEMHRKFIAKSLAKDRVSKYFKAEDFEELYSKFKEIKGLRVKAGRLRKKEDEVKKQKLYNQIKKQEKQYDDMKAKRVGDLSKLFKESGIADLTEGKKSIEGLRSQIEKGALDNVKDKEGLIEITVDSKKKNIKREGALECCDHFKGFTAYFGGFNENRKNVYDCSKTLKKTSIAHRIFEENLEFHFANIARWENFKESIAKERYNEAKKYFSKELRELEKGLGCAMKVFFKPSFLINCFSQKAIDGYNTILGGEEAEAGEEKSQGLNEIINLSRQKVPEKKGEGRDFPRMQELYKQILSKKDQSFIDVIEDDQELLEAIQSFGERLFSQAKRHRKEKLDLFADFQKNVKEHLEGLNEEELGTHFLRREAVRKLSMELCGSWDTLDICWEKIIQEEREQKKIKKKEADDKIKQALLSFDELNQIFAHIKEFDKNRDEKHGDSRDEDHAFQGFRKEWQEVPTDQILVIYIKQALKESISEGREYEKAKKDEEGNPIKDKQGHSIQEKVFIDSIRKSWQNIKKLFVLKELDKNENKRNEQVALIKSFFDSCLSLSRLVRDLSLKGKEAQINSQWKVIIDNFSNEFDILGLYNKARNHLTKKLYELDKIKLNFENEKLASGWDINKETDNSCILFMKDEQYYLGIMAKGHNDLFNYTFDIDDMTNPKKAKARNKKDDLKKRIKTSQNKAHYKKIVYKLLPGPNKMLPKVFFSDKRIDYFSPSKEIQRIRNRASHTKGGEAQEGFNKREFNLKDCRSMIDFYKSSLEKHPEWREYNFQFSRTKEYQSIDQFYGEVAAQAYKIDFDFIREEYINEAVDSGKLYLFQVYNKDFSKHSKGKPNLHTQYWRFLFAKENLKDVVLKLNGEAELFFRKASLEKLDSKKATHPKNKAIQNKNPFNGKKTSKFPYDLIKDKRFREDKYFFHVPISLNFKAKGAVKLNQEILKFLNKNNKVNIIGIDRGERHLLYYSIIDQKAKIIKQGSLNSITVKDRHGNSMGAKDYHKLLDKKEKERDEARKDWSKIENIKELKAGYLSLVVHELAQLIIEHNAIVVLEDLNVGFKRGRFKVEKQVYQKFERALIQKLNYLVFKTRETRKEAGHYLNAYQLTDEFQSFEKLGKQSGILFYTVASYTSKTDPVSGFMKGQRTHYENIEKALDFWSTFDSIRYNNKAKRFEFCYTEKNETTKKSKEWTICSNVSRAYYTKKSGSKFIENITQEIEQALKNNGIDYQKNPDLKELLLAKKERKDRTLHRNLMWLYDLMLNMRVTHKEKEHDYILSPVEPFFDSRKYEKLGSKAPLPIDSDANGAYNVARKGLLTLKQINDSDKASEKTIKLDKIDKEIWREYVQSPKTNAQQKEFMK